MTFELIPTNSFDGVFLEESAHQIIEFSGEVINPWELSLEDHGNEVFEGAGAKGRLPRGELIEDTPQRPEIGEERVDPSVLEEFGGHVVRGPRLEFGLVRLIRGHIIYFLGKSEVVKLEVAVFIEEDVLGLEV
eukprot:CAMPEP_0170540768 /NCGR_PEP_ID=MMETSP0211-20121228/712_1 /TAXON_ID=311385 /ORGANISM="Pseudokeronopsis sp., Strain OXSARD2" /LENGTH=132 /DNA_ID=CAMNT_0010843295 /DNA_START=3477 /DNA_END=3875 /DNA_ORIENTATION=+